MPKDKEKYYGNSIFIGYAASKDGKLISMDGDIYEEVCNKLKGRDIGIKIS